MGYNIKIILKDYIYLIYYRQTQFYIARGLANQIFQLMHIYHWETKN